MSDGPLEQALRDANAELLRRIEDLSFVRVVGDALAGAVEPAAIGTALVTLLRDELRADLAALWAVDELGTGVRLVAVCRTGEDAPARGASDGPLVPFSAGALGTAAAGHVVAIPDVDAAAAGDVPSEAADVRALLLHPVGARGRTLGVVALGSSEPHGLDAGHERLLGLVAPLVGMALESAALYGRVSVENRALRAELGERYGRAGLVGSSPAFRRLLALIERLADVDVTVLVLGASGTGKEMVARALHWGGRRRDAPFVAINCAALPEALLESELFGIERGVATGVERRAGLIERATGGTLFLDEIGDMSPLVQAKILRVLQEREVTRVGGARAIPVDVRVIAATHRELEMLVREGRFREDLYFRLKVATLHVPSLAERREDVPLLAQHFLARFARKHRREGLRFSSDALAALAARPWPGNVRELENAVEQAVVLAEGPVVGLPDAPDAGAPEQALDYRRVVGGAADGAERTLIERALAATGHNRTHAARLLGIGRRTLLYKLKRHGLGKPKRS
ncbi:MAG TPA: sigma-54-dependent Fis family transcriptional regulator [Candidatus Binatia bacterium]|nr:sigma-54-dependent Fis family transcriptional regulator [Candidatus Binatia bacterium]